MKNSGFTLIELMVVVGIIGIIAMFAVPAYDSYRASALQKAGFQMLNAYYTSAQATHAEFGHYPGNLVQTGFRPIGANKYRLRADDGKNVNLPLNDDDCWNTGRPCDCSGTCPSYKTWSERPAEQGIVGSRIGHLPVSGAACSTLGNTNVTDHTFIVGVSAVINTDAAQPDRYFMNERKILDMCSSGLR